GPSAVKRFRPAELAGYLRQKLPEHMVPADIIALDALPLTPNGKVDRRALPALRPAQAPPDRPFVPPRTPEEQQVAAIWADVLGVERVGVDDNFFERGGNSLSLIQVHN